MLQTVDPAADTERLLGALGRWAARLCCRPPASLHGWLDPDDRRTYLCIAREPDHEVWLVRWPTRSVARTHGHGGALGAMTMLQGSLVERWRTGDHAVRWRTSTWSPGVMRTFGAGHIHRVANQGAGVAYSLHAYAPRLEDVTFHREAAPGHVSAVCCDDAGAWL